MRKKGWNKWRIAGTVLGVVLLATGAGFTAYRYRDGGFQPGSYASMRDKRENQITFPGQDMSSDEDESGDSELWEQNDAALDNVNSDKKPSASFLFQTKKVTDTDQTDQDTDAEKSQADKTDTVYSSDQSKKKKDDKTVVDGSGDGNPGNNGPDNGNGGGSSEDTDNGGGDGNKPGKPGKGDDDGKKPSKPADPSKPGKDDGDDNKPGKDDGDDNNNDDNKPGKDDGNDDNNPSDPGTEIVDLDTTVPNLPKDDEIINADPYPGDDKVDIKDDEDYKRYSLRIIGIRDNEDIINNLYMGEYLNDRRVICSVIVYVCVDGTPKYRLTELGDNFKLGSYPKQVTTDTVDLTFYYRPSEKYSWIKGTYKSSVMYSAKLLLRNWSEGEYIEQYLVPNDNNKVMLFQYYSEMYENTSDKVGNMFLGWSATRDGDSVGPFYSVTKTGAQVMYPISGSEPVDGSLVEWQKYGMDIDNNFYYKDLQTLTQYSGWDEVLDIQEGIQAVSLPVDIDWDTFDVIKPTFEEVNVPSSMLVMGGTFGDAAQADSYSFQVLGSYVVDSANAVYSSYKGMLMDKSRTKIYDIPVNMDSITVPAAVQNIHFAYDNNISEIYFKSSRPADIDFSLLTDTKIYVPADSYIRYLSAWGKNPGGNGNELLPDDGDEPQFVQDDEAIYSQDGKTLVAVKSDIEGVYVVPDGVEAVASGALENCGQIDILILPASINKLDSGSLSANAPGKVVFLGDAAPAVENDTFADATILQIKKTAEDEYSSAWYQVVTDLSGRACFMDFTYVNDGKTGFEYLDEAACEHDQAGAILIRAASDLKTFNSESVPSVVWKSIAPKAFVNCGSLYMAELPDTVKSVGQNAFAGCSALQGVVSYSMDTMTVGEGAFDDTLNLRFLAFDAVWLDCYSYSGSAAFYASCNGYGYGGADRFSPIYYLDDVNGGKLLYGAAADDEGNATDGCYLLGATLGISGDIKLRTTATEIAVGVFMDCANEFTLEGMDHLIAIGENAFRNSGISGEIYIGGEYVYVGDYAFCGCANITSVVIDGSSLEKNIYVRPLGSGVFSWCTGIEKLTIRSGGHYDLSENAFMGCTGLTSVDIARDAGIADVSYGAFSQTAITEITLPENLQGIGYYAFSLCSELKQVVLTGTKVPELYVYSPGMEFGFSETDESGWLKVPEGSEQSYIDTWKYYMLGRTPDDAPFLTDEEVLSSENRVRRILGMPEVSGESAGDTQIATASDAVRIQDAEQRDDTDYTNMEGER